MGLKALFLRQGIMRKVLISLLPILLLRQADIFSLTANHGYAKITEVVGRAYSISSPPSQKGSIELIIRRVPEGICTTFLHEHIQEGDEITFAGPFGELYLHDGGFYCSCNDLKSGIRI